MVKISRISTYSSNMTEENEILKEIDGQFIKKFLSQEAETFMDTILMKQIEKFDFKLTLEALDAEINYQIPAEDNASAKVRRWSLPLAFSNLSLADTMFIYHALLREIPLIFISKKLSLLTHTM